MNRFPQINLPVPKRWISALLLIPLLFCGVPGCQNSASDSTEEQSGDDANSYSHAPDYKPKTFEQAVNEIEQKLEQLQESAKEGNQKRAQSDLENLREFVNWLPELAGDSDMQEKEWNTVKSVSNEMLGILDDASGQFSNGNLDFAFDTKLTPLLTKQKELISATVDEPAGEPAAQDDTDPAGE